MRRQATSDKMRRPAEDKRAAGGPVMPGQTYPVTDEEHRTYDHELAEALRSGTPEVEAVMDELESVEG